MKVLFQKAALGDRDLQGFGSCGLRPRNGG